MNKHHFEIETTTPFSESLIWQLNRDFYHEQGIDAWSDNIVPHHLTSNSLVGKTYAELILAFLKDLSRKGATKEIVYILELGAGHGRLAFHILKHLQKIIFATDIELPPYCYVLSDIVEDNLTFFGNHPQFQEFFNQGILDISYFDGVESTEIVLRNAKVRIGNQNLNQPLLVIANYFFDSLPNDLFVIHDKLISICSASLYSETDPSNMSTEELIKNMKFTYSKRPTEGQHYDSEGLNDILKMYVGIGFDTHLFFPRKGLECLMNLRSLSNSGMALLTMDKGFHELQDLDERGDPDIIAHGSMSLWVNYHALSALCEQQNGTVLFPSFSTFHLEIGCLLFLPDSDSYHFTDEAFRHFVNDFGPDDFNSVKKLAYFNVSQLKIQELIALIRLSAYDSTFFITLLPQFKQLIATVTSDERKRLSETFNHICQLYFHIDESFDLSYELGGLFYDLGFYQKALNQFNYSIDLFGHRADIYYNKVLCYYQLRWDDLFIETLDEAKLAFPANLLFDKLDDLDMTAA